MKNFLLILMAWPLTCFPQQSQDLQRELQSIADKEKKGAEVFFQNRTGTVSSANFNIHHYTCEWKVDPAVRYINGMITATFSVTSATNSITFDCSLQLNIDSVRYHGAPISFQRDIPESVTLQFPATLNVNAKDSVSIYYQGVPTNSGFGAFYQGDHAGVPVIWTLSEPYGATEWWPCKNGLDDKADSIDIFLTYPSTYVGSSIGMLIDQQTAGGYTTDHFTHHHPIASYLMAFAVTNYLIKSDTIQVNNKTYPFISYAYPEQQHSLFPFEFYTKECFRFFCESFGDYPFEKYGETQFHWQGGMEHQTNSFVLYTTRLLTSHELGHQWFGDLVTCGSWSDIWLNEGFAEYCTYTYFEKFYPPLHRNILLNAANRVFVHPDGSVYVTDTSDVNRIFYSRLTYNKGMYVVHMLRWVLGDSLFYKGLRQYLNDPALRFGFAKTADLQKHLEQVSGKDLSKFFQQWVYGEGNPSYSASFSQNNNFWAKVKLDQTTSHPSVGFYEMPVQLVFRNGQQTKKFVVDHKHTGQEFWINVGFVADTLMIDPDTWILAQGKNTVKETQKNTIADEILVYPNPAPGSSKVILRNPTGNSFSLQLFNALGQRVYSNTVQTPGRDETFILPFEKLARGAYWLRLRNDKGLQLVKKMIH